MFTLSVVLVVFLCSPCLGKIGGSLIPPTTSLSASPQCRNDSLIYRIGLTMRRQWALQMLDATGKVPDGILYLNFNDLGSWQECLDVTVAQWDAHFQGQYCGTWFFANSSRTDENRTTYKLSYFGKWGICLPSSCSATDITVSLMEKLPGLVPKIDPANCHVKNEPVTITAGDIVVFVWIALTVTLVSSGTLLDFLEKKKCHSEASSFTVNTNSPGRVKSVGREIVRCFSLYSTATKLFNTSPTSSTLTCLHGIRFISMTWVVLCHTYLMALSNIPWTNSMNALQAIGKWPMMAIRNGFSSVDTFFLLSGLLVAYVFTRQMDKGGAKFGPKELVLFYLHRYLRLTPVYAFAIACTATLYIHLGRGPFYGSYIGSQAQACRDIWWQNILYINNLTEDKTMCLGQAWYLAVDMQLFLLSPLVLVPLVKYNTAGKIWLLLLTVASVVVPGYITFDEKLPPTSLDNHQSLTEEDGDIFHDRYEQFYCRAAPYLVGVYTGYLLHGYGNSPPSIPRVVNVFLWLVAVATGLAVIYGPCNDVTWYDSYTTTQAIAYASLGRLAWGIAVAWVIFACATGHGGPVNNLLSWAVWVPLSRLTYVTYLTSLMVQMWYNFMYGGTMYFSHIVMVYMFFGHLVFTVMIAIPLSLGFESPAIGLEKLMFQVQTKEADKMVTAGRRPPDEALKSSTCVEITTISARSG